MSRFLDNFSSIRAYRDALDAGQFSVTDATKALLADIERHQVLNAFVDVDARAARNKPFRPNSNSLKVMRISWLACRWRTKIFL